MDQPDPDSRATPDSADHETSDQQPNPDGETTVGPLAVDIIRPARFLTSAQAGGMTLVLVAAIVAALALLPRTLAGLGLLAPTAATVTSTGTHGDNPDTSCTLTEVQLEWGDDHSDSLTWCSHDGEAVPKVGDRVEVWVLPSFGPSQATSRSTNTVLAVLLIVVALGSGAGSLIYGRRLRAIRALEHQVIPTVALHGQIDRLTKQRGAFKKDVRARARIVFRPGPDGAYQPLTVTLPQMSDVSLLGAKILVYPAGRTRRGERTGPYVLRRIRYGDSPSGTLVGLGRAYRTEHGNRVRAPRT